jgi:hypothetical protein
VLTCDGEIFGFQVKYGQGKLAVVGDAGLVSNGLYHFPGFENAAFLNKLFRDMAPAWSAAPVTTFECFEFGHVSCGTSEQGISEKLFRTLRPQARFEIDHHYRHLTFESKPSNISAGEVAARLPLKLAELAHRKTISARFPFVNVCDGRDTARFELALNVSAKASEMGVDYVISGTKVSEGVTWNDIGADPVVFGALGQLIRVNTIVQILAGTNPDGTLRYFSVKQGQILYDRNAKNTHYGFDILLGSRNVVFSPTRVSSS